MRVTYIKLENVAGLMVGLDRNVLEINFNRAKNIITTIQAPNGSGKSVLLSSISPFASVTSVDERSTLPYIKTGKNGYKEIHYQDGEDEYIIKHYYKASKDTHTVKSYMSLNGEELNENGNVTSFLALVEIHFGLTPEMMRLVRLGTNVNSFITLSPTKRKSYIGQLIDEIDTYLRVHKNVNDDLRVVKVMLQSNSQNLYNCHITDLLSEKSRMKDLTKDIKKAEKYKESVISKISELESLMKTHDINDLRRQKQEAEMSINELQRLRSQVQQMRLSNVQIDQLVRKRADISDTQMNTQAKINSYRISIDNTLVSIERLETALKRITSDNDIQSLVRAINDLRSRISVSDTIKSFRSEGLTSDQLKDMINKLSSYNKIGQMLYTLGNKPAEIYLRLVKNHQSVDKYLKDQASKASKLNKSSIMIMLDSFFGEDGIITPNCTSLYEECPYYRISELLSELKDQIDDAVDDEDLRSIQIIARNLDMIMNDVDTMSSTLLPESIRDVVNNNTMMDRFKHKQPLFDMSGMYDYMTLVSTYEDYIDNTNRLKQYERQLSMYRKSGAETHLQEIRQLRDNIQFYQDNIRTLTSQVASLSNQLDEIDRQIAIITKLQDAEKHERLYTSSLESASKLLSPLESAESELRDLRYKLTTIRSSIESLQHEHKSIETKLAEYDRLTKERDELTKKNDDLSIILEAVSTRKGIPVVYMQKYLGSIQKLTNDLLDLTYDGELQIAEFHVTQDTFEIPYIKNGTMIPDVKYASQSEIALITMALSFALSNKASGAYNILLLDEVDAGLDDHNRSAFLRMLQMQMDALKSEQVFMVSHNLSQMSNLPTDCIMLTGESTRSTRLQNVIYP